MKSGRRQARYTLLEVVVAFAILVLSMSALFESFSMTLGRSGKTRNQSRAVLLAESTRDRVGADLPATLPLNEGSDDDCRWSVHSQPLPRANLDHTATVVAVAVSVDVLCGDSGSVGTAHLNTVELTPAR